MTETRTFCRVCEPACGLVAKVQNGEITSLSPDRDHPISLGFACHKGLASMCIVVGASLPAASPPRPRQSRTEKEPDMH